MFWGFLAERSLCLCLSLNRSDCSCTEGDDCEFEANSADILVTEIFDSVLLGEGILPSLAHARQHLLKPGAVCVPDGGVWLPLQQRAEGFSGLVPRLMFAVC